MIAARKQTASNFVRTRLKNQELSRESNGETALQFWQNEIDENSLYLIDEPENSLSAVSQIKLKQFIEESAKHFRCQFVIATHSPILLSIEDAGVYDLDRDPARIRKWTELENVRRYYDFFSEHSAEFEIKDND
jgi:predicted ATPase